MALFYVDSSALVKLLRKEQETSALRAFLRAAEVISSELVVTELPRAIRRAAASNPALPLDLLIRRADRLLDTVAMVPLDRVQLMAAGALAEPWLRAIDAIHVAAAIDIYPHDGFVSYDNRQSAAARLAGLRTFAPSN